MKKQQKELIALAALLVVAAMVWVWNSRQIPRAAQASAIASNYRPMNVGIPAIPWWKIKRVQSTEYKAGGRNPFSAVPPPPPVVRPKQPGDPGYVKPVPPPPPPLELPPNMKFFGYGTVPNGTARRAFLSDGEDVYIVSEGDMLLGRYRILKIGNATIEFQETSSGRQGRANIEDVGPNV
jgi:hypothetical protein